MAAAPRQNRAIIAFGVTSFALVQHGDAILIQFDEDADDVAETVKTLVSMLEKQRDSVFRGLPWRLLQARWQSLYGS